MSRQKAFNRRLAARARFRADVPTPTLFDRLPRKPVIWPKTTRYDYEPEEQHQAKLAALLAVATKTTPRKYGHNGPHPFRRMTEEQRRALPLKLPVLGPRCSACGRWATWDMIVPAAA